MARDRKEVGRRGEDEACRFLSSRGHVVLERNWRYGHLEVDAITLLGNEIHIVEVKSRTAPMVADPQDNVDVGKQRRLAKAASAFLRSHRVPSPGPDLEVVFDIVSVVFDGSSVRIEYFPRAWIPMYL